MVIKKFASFGDIFFLLDIVFQKKKSINLNLNVHKSAYYDIDENIILRMNYYFKINYK